MPVQTKARSTACKADSVLHWSSIKAFDQQWLQLCPSQISGTKLIILTFLCTNMASSLIYEAAIWEWSAWQQIFAMVNDLVTAALLLCSYPTTWNKLPSYISFKLSFNFVTCICYPKWVKTTLLFLQCTANKRTKNSIVDVMFGTRAFDGQLCAVWGCTDVQTVCREGERKRDGEKVMHFSPVMAKMISSYSTRG